MGYAKIDFSNVSVENVGKLLADVGVLTNVTIVDGFITGVLNGVKINADVITAGTLSVGRLLVTGKDSIVYQLNVESSGLSVTELEKEVYQKYLNGTDIVAKSITANQIAAETITAKEIAANAITTAKIASGAITTDKLKARAVTAAKIDVNDLFAQNITATGTITGAKLRSATGEFEGSVTASEIYVNTGINFYFDGNKANKIPVKLVQVKAVGAAAGTRYLSLVAGVETQTSINSGLILQPGLTIVGGANVYGDIVVGTDDSGDIQPGDIFLEKYGIYVGAKINELDNTKLPTTGGTLTGTLNTRNIRVGDAYGIAVGSSASKYYACYNGTGIESNGDFQIKCKSGNPGFFTNGHLYMLKLSGSGWSGIYASEFSVQSTKHSKENFSSITDEEALNLLKIQPMHFDYIRGEKNQSGFIAEDVEEFFPDICSYNVSETEEKNLFGLDYSKFSPYIIKLLQLLHEKVSVLDQKNSDLLVKVEGLEKGR